jgi:hypothetical protein
MINALPSTVLDDPGARRLWDLVMGLKVPCGHERSFRLCRGFLLPNRFLLSLCKGTLGARPDATVLELCRCLGLPERFLGAIAQALPRTGFVHLGFEQDRTACLYKVYLEAAPPASQPTGPDPVLLHWAVKWDAMDPSRCVRTRYQWYPGLSVPDLLGRLARIYDDSAHGEPLAIARDFALLATERVGREGVRYMEVSEEGNVRRSFDLNIYSAGLTLGDILPALSRIAAYFAIPDAQLGSLLEPIQPLSLGHLAGGIHRTGEDFFNVYYGVEECHGAIGADAP